MSEKREGEEAIEMQEKGVSMDEVRADPAEPMLPTTEKPADPPKPALHPAFYIATWIALSSCTILFNKYILSTAGFRYPIILTSWHLTFATIMTQLMARFTHMLDSRKKVPMNGHVYLRKIVPIGLMFSLSLIGGNKAYLYLSVSFIQMLKATMPVVTLITGWAFKVSPPSMKTLGNVSIIVVGVVIASLGEIKFDLTGFLYQVGAIFFEATRLVMVQQLLSGSDFKMDPLVSLYYFAPVCAIMNGVIALFVEVPSITLADLQNVGFSILLLNGLIAFLLNIAVVFLIGKTSSLVMTLSGVLKDILLVCASMLIFRDPVSGLQAFGYAVAIAGLLYYRLGADNMKEYVGHAQRQWADYGARHPILRKVTVFLLVIFTVLMILTAASQSGVVPANMDVIKYAGDRLKDVLGRLGA